MTSTFRLLCGALSLSVLAGCPGGTEAPDGGRDAPSPLDAPTSDVAPVLDAPASDVAPVLDAPATPDAGRDAAVADAGSDAGCTPVECEPPGPGCHYEGATECDCGRLVCEPVACAEACEVGEYCDQCASSPTCAPHPPGSGRVCPGIYDPVCGCDGRTYSSACVAGAEGMPVQREGECDAPPPPGCDPACNAGESCQPCETPDGRVDYVCLPDGAVC